MIDSSRYDLPLTLYSCIHVFNCSSSAQVPARRAPIGRRHVTLTSFSVRAWPCTSTNPSCDAVCSYPSSSLQISSPRLYSSHACIVTYAADVSDRRCIFYSESFIPILMPLPILGSRVVSVLVSGTEGPGFKSQSPPRRCRVTVIHCASVHQTAKLVAALLRVVGETAGLAESNGSLPSGSWLTSLAGWLPRTGISSGTLRSAIEYGLLFYPFCILGPEALRLSVVRLCVRASVKLLCSVLCAGEHTSRMRILWILKIRRIQEFLWILKTLMNSTNKICYIEKLQIGWKSFMQTYIYKIIDTEKQHCNISRANIGVLVLYVTKCSSQSSKLI